MYCLVNFFPWCMWKTTKICYTTLICLSNISRKIFFCFKKVYKWVEIICLRDGCDMQIAAVGDEETSCRQKMINFVFLCVTVIALLTGIKGGLPIFLFKWHSISTFHLNDIVFYSRLSQSWQYWQPSDV